MNYLERIEIPISLKTGKEAGKYLEPGKKHPPDYFVNTAEEQQQNALNMPALPGKALKAFSHTGETIKDVPRLKGLLEEGKQYQL